MVQRLIPSLDRTFAALSDPSRRGVLERLGRSDATVSELATAFGMTVTGMKKHIGVLEGAGLVTTEKQGRTRTCRLGPARLEAEAAWLAAYRATWAARFDALDAVLADLKNHVSAPEGPDP
jgi:DNA-binding transcriptional ArsR family regulator